METSKAKAYAPLNGPEPKPLRTIYRVLPMLALGLTSSISIALLEIRVARNVYTGSFYLWTRNHSVQTSVVVNILAQVLAFLQIFVLSTLVDHSARARPRFKAVLLNILKLWNALVLNGVEWSLPPWTLLPVFLYCVALFLPAIGWVAALNPNPTATSPNINITVPEYIPDPQGLY